MQSVTVRVPASTSNLGPGFDCLGVALRLYNRVTLIRGPYARQPPVVHEAGRLFFRKASIKAFRFSAQIEGDVPRARGLGSSATARLGVLHGLNQLAGEPLSRLEIFHICAELERHPDNAAPANFGGFTIAAGNAVQRFPVSPQLRFVLLVPDVEVKTSDARSILPRQIIRTRAVENCGNACAITAAFARKSYEDLRGHFNDHLHQPYRRKLQPWLNRVVAAAEQAGAVGAFLSGSGSTIAAIAMARAEQIGSAMQKASKMKSAAVIVTGADNNGAQPVRPPASS